MPDHAAKMLPPRAVVRPFVDRPLGRVVIGLGATLALLGVHAAVFAATGPELPFPSPIWPISGIAFALAWLFGLRSIVPAIVISTFVAFAWKLDDLVTPIPGALFNALEAFVAVTLLRKLGASRHIFTEVRSTLLWLTVAVVLAPSVSACLHTLTQIFASDVSGITDALLTAFLVFLSNLAGSAAFGPPILLMVQRARLQHPFRRPAECVSIVALALVLACAAFVPPPLFEMPFPRQTLLFLALPIALYATFRLGPRPLAAVLTIFVVGAYLGVGFGNGPFSDVDNRNDQLFAVGVFLAVLAATPLVVLSLLVERRHNAEALAQALNRERLYRGELDHRVRNNFGNILALIDLSAQSASDMQHFADAIADRVRTMSSAHELLASRPNEPIDLAELLGGLTPDDAGRHIDVAGPTCLVHPSRVRAIAMVFAELFTNARRHGALTRDDARIRIEWSREDEPDRWLLRWSEVGCDISDDSPIEGTGRKLVNGFARSELEGEADWRFEPDGLRFTLHLRTDARPTAPVPDYTSDRRPTSRFRAPEV